MSQVSLRGGLIPAFRLGIVAAAALAAAGCADPSTMETTGVSITLRPSWKPVAEGTYLVAGKPIGSWSGPEGSSLSIFQVLPTPEIARGLARPEAVAKTISVELANRATNLPGAKVLKSEVATVAGRAAAAVEWSAPGTGDAIAPSGVGTPVAPKGKTLIPTVRITRAIPRATDTIFVMFHAPESVEARLRPEIDAALDALRVDEPGAESAY